MPDSYRSVAAEGVHGYEVNRSRFRCALAPVADEAQAQAFLARVRREHPGASHHCWAYVLGADGAVQRAGDDGEPGGTAGQPMLAMLTRREVRFTIAVVSRWFGGVKLGAGGLIRAYGGVVGEALDAVGTVTRRRCRLASVTCGHERAGRLENDLRGAGRTVRDVHYGAEVTVDVAVPDAEIDAFRAWLSDATSGTAVLHLSAEVYEEVPADRG